MGAGGFGVLDDCDPGLVNFLVERGAVLDAHSAARLGLMAELRELVAADPSVVHAPGGDGQMPLHFASTVEVAQFLLENGAEINALDTGHDSTPAQYMLRVQQKRHYPRDRQEVARYLVSRGCQTDLLMAAALGDANLVLRHLESDPACIRLNVSEEWFPKRDPRAGGTIYLSTLGPHRTAHSVAREFGHEEIFQLLVEHTPDELKLALACEIGDEAVFQKFLAQNPNAARTLSENEKQKLPDAAHDNNTTAVRLMLEAGWPVDTAGEMGAAALHWAGFNGNAQLTREILRFHPTLELKSKKYRHGSGVDRLRLRKWLEPGDRRLCRDDSGASGGWRCDTAACRVAGARRCRAGGVAMNANKRPITVWVVSCLYIAVGAIGFAYHLRELMALQPDSVWVESNQMIGQTETVRL